MSRRDGSDHSTAGRLALFALGVMLLAGFIAFAWTTVETIGARREMADQAAEQHCEEREGGSCESLEAEIRSAAAAEAAADVAVAQMWVGFLGLIGVAATVIYARAAYIASHRAAEAAYRTLEHGRAHLVAELGAIENTAAGAENLKGSISVKNVGQTPAYNVSSKLTLNIVKLGGSGEIPDYSDVKRVHLVIGPTLSKRMSLEWGRPITAEEVAAVAARESILVLGGTVVYDDIFGKTWWTQFCHVYRGPKFEGVYHTELNRAGGPI